MMFDARRSAVVVLGPGGGEIGRHSATVDQLFMVVSGSGLVCGADQIWQPIRAGQAAVWVSGEHHTTRAEEPIMAVVIEMESLSSDLRFASSDDAPP